MKRRNKCLIKKAYAWKHAALDAAAKAYKERGVELGIYECPVCLDFHLTSKYCNTKHYHKKWLKTHIKAQYKEFLALEAKMVPQPPKPPKLSRYAVKRKAVTLPYAKQREIFATLPKPQKTWWQKIKDLLR